MSETPKRRRGDRRDAVLLRETDALHFIMGSIYPHRADNEAYIAERIDLEPIKAYLAKKNVEGIEFKYTFFHVIVAALVKTITLRPKLNRFYANENYYQRNKVTADKAFAMCNVHRNPPRPFCGPAVPQSGQCILSDT